MYRTIFVRHRTSAWTCTPILQTPLFADAVDIDYQTQKGA